jgi:hypothetical protein
MKTVPQSHVPFAQLPAEARTLLYVFAVATIARYTFVCPTSRELAPRLETIWNTNGLVLANVSDPCLMTAIFKCNSAFLLNSLTWLTPEINLADELNGGAR